MGSTGERQKARERAQQPWAVLILHHLEILGANSAAWEFFKLFLVCRLSICVLHVVHCVFGKRSSLFSPLLPSTVVADAKLDLSITHFLNFSSNTDTLIRKQHIQGHVDA